MTTHQGVLSWNLFQLNLHSSSQLLISHILVIPSDQNSADNNQKMPALKAQRERRDMVPRSTRNPALVENQRCATRRVDRVNRQWIKPQRYWEVGKSLDHYD
jgi:hypothetical protein